MKNFLKKRLSKRTTNFSKTGLILGVLGVSWFGLTQAGSQEINLPIGDPDQKLMAYSLKEIKADPDLFRYALNKGGAAFARNCTRCHGPGGKGGEGIPALNDKDWIWGGTFSAIQWTIQHGVRGEDELTRRTSMPIFSANTILTEDQAEEMAQFVLSLRGTPDMESPIGEEFKFLCSRCHGPYGGGSTGFGGPSLVDDVWLHGGSVDQIKAQILHPQHGVMPAWEGILPEETIKALAVYVHQLGGGVN